MKIKRLIIEHDDIQELGKVASQFMGKEYVSATDDMIVIGTESYKLRNNSTQWNMVVLKKKDGKAQIDIIGTAGGYGLFNISWWSESGFTKRLFRHYVNQCEVKGWSFEEIA